MIRAVARRTPGIPRKCATTNTQAGFYLNGTRADGLTGNLAQNNGAYGFVLQNVSNSALNGNTAPYLLYAYARIQSIFRKGNLAPLAPDTAAGSSPTLELDAPQELNLAKHLLNLNLVLEAVAAEFRPNFLCNYLYELAGLFTSFYENCPVLKAEPARRESRLRLCDLTARALKLGLGLLGIEVVDQM